MINNDSNFAPPFIEPASLKAGDRFRDGVITEAISIVVFKYRINSWDKDLLLDQELLEHLRDPRYGPVP